jgi:hypothetical protein
MHDTAANTGKNTPTGRNSCTHDDHANPSAFKTKAATTTGNNTHNPGNQRVVLQFRKLKWG